MIEDAPIRILSNTKRKGKKNYYSFFKKKEPEKLGKVVKLTLSKARLSCLSKSTRLLHKILCFPTP
jgi:hypothetical protein